MFCFFCFQVQVSEDIVIGKSALQMPSKILNRYFIADEKKVYINIYCYFAFLRLIYPLQVIEGQKIFLDL